MRTKLLIFTILLCCLGGAVAQDAEKCGKDKNNDEGKPADCNGISVGAPKVFDNRSLTLMLEKLNQNLQSQRLNFIDPTTLKAALANLQGLSTSETSVSGSVTGNPTPALTEGTTFNSGNVDANGNRVPNTFQRTTSANQASVTPQAPGFDTLPGLPSGFNPTFGSSASDLLNDQANLNYQVVNLQMILERSLSDRTLNEDPKCVDVELPNKPWDVRCTRLQAVLGFNVTLDPPRTANDAVAVVEVTLSEKDGKPSGNGPMYDNGGLSLVALMPQEKTYNAAALSTKSHAFSGAAVAGVFQVGASARKRAQVFYLYRDTDTLSYERMTDAGELVFGWMFRPVLGRRSVSPGLRNMFAVLALPKRDCTALDEQENKTNPEHPCQAELRTTVRTYWKKYDRNTMTSFVAADANRARNYWYNLSFDQARPQLFSHHGYQNGLDYIDLPVYSSSRYERLLSPKVDSVEWISTGAKSVVVLAKGNNFFTDTAVTLGDKVYTNPSGGLSLKSNQSFDLTTTIDQLVDGPGAILGRYGPATPLILDGAPSELAPCGMKIEGATTTAAIAGVLGMDITLQSGVCPQPPPAPPAPPQPPAPLTPPTKLQEAAALAQAAVTTAQAGADEAAKNLADEKARPHSAGELALPGFEKRQEEALTQLQREVDRTNASLAKAKSHQELVSNNLDRDVLPRLTLSRADKLLQTPIVSVNGTALDLPYDVYPEVTKSVTGDVMRLILHVNLKESLLSDGGATVKVTWPFYNTDKWTSTLRYYTPTLGFEVTRVSDKSIVISRINGGGVSFSNAPENLSNDKPNYACWKLIAGDTAIPLRTDACPCPPTGQPRSCEKKPTPKQAEANTGSSDKDQPLDLGSALPYTVSATVAKMPSHVILLAPNGTAYRLAVPDLTDKKAAPPAPLEMKQGDAAWISITVPVGKTPLKIEANGKNTLQFRPAAKDDSKPADPKVQTFNVEITRDLTAKTGTIDMTVLDKDSKPIAGTVPQKITITCSQCTDKTADKGDK